MSEPTEQEVENLAKELFSKYWDVTPYPPSRTNGDYNRSMRLGRHVITLQAQAREEAVKSCAEIARRELSTPLNESDANRYASERYNQPIETIIKAIEELRPPKES